MKASQRASILQHYREHLRGFRIRATIAAAFHSFTRFLSLCALTWATVVLLGGFASSLQESDFYIVSSLLLIEAARPATADFFGRVVIGRLSHHILYLSYGDTLTERQFTTLPRLRWIAPMEQFFLLVPSFVLASRSLHSKHYDSASPFSTMDFSLSIFYAVVLFHACVATVSMIYSIWINGWILPATTPSVQRYYDEVFGRAVSKGLLRSEHFDLFAFFFSVQGQAYSRNVVPHLLKDAYKDFIEYLYAHDSGKEVVTVYLDSNVCFERQAAACMVGFWGEMGFLKLPEALLTKLADRIGIGQTGWAAVQSFGILTEKKPAMVVDVCNSKGENVYDLLTEILDPCNPHSQDCLMAMVRLLQIEEKELEHMFGEEQEEKIRSVFLDGCRQEMRVLAGYCLMKMSKLRDEDQQIVQDIISSSPTDTNLMLCEICDFLHMERD